MSSKIKDINSTLIQFWDQALTLPEEDKAKAAEQEVGDCKDLAPSEKLYLAARELGACKKTLDYGCGDGWASIIIAKNGCPDVTAVDLGKNIIDTANFYMKLYGVQDQAKALAVSSDWLQSVPDASFDGFVCSNVLDVVPLETSEVIIQEAARILNKDAKIVIGLNFYMSPEAASARGMELVDGKYLFVNGVLRLASLSDEEWTARFEPYFEVEKLEYFAWPGEPKETRRLFRLKKK